MNPPRVIAPSVVGRLIGFGIAFGVLAIPSPRLAQATSATWNGTTDGNWATPTNWSATPVPGTGNTATFNNAGNGQTTLSLGAGVTIGTILFDTANAAPYTIGSAGSQTLTIDNGGAVTMNASVAASELFNSAVVLGTSMAAATYTFTNESTTNSLTFAGNISRNGTTNTKTLTVSGAGNSTVSGIISGSALALTKTGPGRLTLTNANTFTGAIKVNQGILRIENGGALGTTAGGITVGDAVNQIGASLQLVNVTVGNEPLTLSGGYAANATGALEGVSGTNNYGGLLTLATAPGGNSYFITITADAGSTLNLTNTGTITGGSTMGLSGDGDGSVAGIIGSTVGAIYKQGNGTWTLTGANTQTGPVTIKGGTLRLAGAGQLGSPAIELRMDAGVLDLGGRSQTVSSVNPASGLSAMGTILNNGNGASTLTVGNGNADGAFGGTIMDHTSGTGTVTLTKIGTGFFSLGAANSYSGATMINAGVFVIGHGDSLGTTTNGTTVANNATLILGGNCIVGAEPLTIGGDGATGQAGALESNGDDTWGGPIALTTSTATVVSSNFGTLNLTNTISGTTRPLTLTGAGDGIVSGAIGTTSTLTKSGTGKWTLSGANTYTGATTVSAGILNIQNATGTGTTAGGVTVASGATLQIQGNITVGAEALTISGSGASGATGTMENVSGTNSYGGLLKLGAGGAAISSDTGTLNLTNTGTIFGTSTGLPLILKGDGDGSLAGVWNGGTSGTAGAGTLTKSGAGTWTLSGANTFTGALTIAAGTLAIPTINNASAAGPLGNSATAVTLGSTGGVSGTLEYTGATASSTKPFTLASGGSGRFQIDTVAANLTLSGAIGGSGALVKTGPGALTLSAANSYGGGTTISAGRLVVGNDGALGSGPITMNGGVIAPDMSGREVSGLGVTINPVVGNTIDVPASMSFYLGGSFNGAGTVTKTGSGSLTLGGNNPPFSGTFTVAQGDAALNFVSGSPSATWDVVGGARLIGVKSGLSTVIELGELIGAGTLKNFGEVTFSVGAKGTSTIFSGVIANHIFYPTLTTPSTHLTKVGSGTLTLAGANPYSGQTQVSAGTLSASVAGAISGSSGITVNPGGTLALAGTGGLDRIGNAVPLALNGGSFSTAGLSDEPEMLGNLSVSANSTIDFGAGSGDSLIFAGVGPHTAGTRLAITNWSGTPHQLGGGSSDRLLFAGSTSAFTGLYNQADVSFNGVTGYLAIQDGINFEIVGIPEPSAALLAGAGAIIGLAGLRGRRRAPSGCRGDSIRPGASISCDRGAW